MKECDFYWGEVETYSDPSYIFSGSRPLQSHSIYTPDWSMLDCCLYYTDDLNAVIGLLASDRGTGIRGGTGIR